MTNHITVESHRVRIRRLFLVSHLFIVGFLLALDFGMLWLVVTPSAFMETPNLVFLGGLFAIVVGGGFYQLHKLRGDGAKVAKLLGGTLVVLNPRKTNLRVFRNVATETAIAAGIPMPRLFVLESDRGINAFAAGTLEEGTAVCVSAGALERLSRNELQGVIAHEMAHLRHDDVAVSRMLAAGVFGLMCISLLGYSIVHAGLAAEASNRRKKDQGGGVLIALAGFGVAVVGAVGWLSAQVLDACTSREMELRADADAARMLSDSSGLVGALVKLGIESKEFPQEASEWLKPHNPMYFREGAKAYWFDTHPPLLDRIRALDPAKAAELVTEMGG